jgi:dienelactone hydrolase
VSQPGNGPIDRLVELPLDKVKLAGNLVVSQGAAGIVVFAHGSGSSRFSPRNQRVAKILRETGLATLLLDLLTPEEEAIDQRTAQLRFDIHLLAVRIVAVTRWLKENPETGKLKVGYFGSSTGGGAALVAAAEIPEHVHAVVSRGGRPDLADQALPQVKAPTLLIVGGDDEAVIGMNQRAMQRMQSDTKLEIIPGASHLFEEPGALDRVAELARQWFTCYLG